MLLRSTFPHAKRMAVLEVARADEFAPVKNAPGAANDSPDTARALIFGLGRRRLEAAGAKIATKKSAEGKSARVSLFGGSSAKKAAAEKAAAEKAKAAGGGGGDVPVVEISPLLSYEGEGLEWLKGKTLNPPVLLSEGD